MGVVDWLGNGLWGLSAWGIVLYVLVVTHITIITVTVYLHRYSAHRSLDLHPALQHFFRFWSWLTTGMITREWTAIHRKHHAATETEDDPHSPGCSASATYSGEAQRLTAPQPGTPLPWSAMVRAAPTTGWNAISIPSTRCWVLG